MKQVKSARQLARWIAAQLPEFEHAKNLSEFKIRLLSSQFIDFKILCGTSHEPETIAALKRLVKPGMTAVDVGANIGWITLHLASLVGANGKVIALEPSDWTYERLLHNIQLNAFSWVIAERAAVGSDDISDVQMLLPRGYRLDWKDTATKQNVSLIKLDTAMAKHGRIDFIKSDTDGYELQVFKGAREILSKYRPILLIEVAPEAAPQSRGELIQLFSYLSEFGYQFEDESGKLVDPRAEMNRLSGRSESINVIART